MTDGNWLDSEPPGAGSHVGRMSSRTGTQRSVWSEVVGRLRSSGTTDPGDVRLAVDSLLEEEEEEDLPAPPDKLPGHTCHTCLWKLHACVNRWVFQVLCMALTLVHSAGYYMDWGRLSTEGKWRSMAMIWGSFLPLVCISIFEVLVRVSGQGGPLCLFSSWLRFYSLVLHQLEALFVIGLCYRLSRSTHLMVQFTQKEEVELADFSLTEDRITVPTLIGYRLFRAYGVFFDITVQTVRKRRERRNKFRAVWWEDQEARVLAHRARTSVYFQEKMDTKFFQIVIISVVVLHCGLYTTSRSVKALDRYFFLSKFTGYSVCGVFALEFLVRATAQGGIEEFFYPRLQKIEAFFMLLGISLTAYSSYYHFAIAESRSMMEPSGILTAIALIIQRGLRFLGIYWGISGSELGADSILGSQTVKLFRQKFDDILKLPEENLLVRIKAGNLTVRVQKAEIRASAFEHLHLPITVRGGLVEDLYVMVKNEIYSESTRNRRLIRGKPMTKVSVKNLLVLFGPGDGLAEAAGMEPMGRYWNHDTIRTAKAKLVELIHVHLTAPSGEDQDFDPSERLMGGEEVEPPPKSALGVAAARLLQRTKTRARGIIRSACLRHVEVDIRRVALQYDDVEGRLGCGAVSLGARLGDASMDAQNGRYVHATVLRLGLFVKHHHHSVRARDRADLWALLESHPELAKQELERLDRIDTFRTWAFEELTRRMHVFDSLRHKRMETWRDQHEVFSLAKLQFGGMPLNQVPELQSTSSVDPLECVAIPGSKQAQEWQWSVDVTPVRTSIDELQARCVKTIVASSNAWLLHDNAFKWWPYLNLADAAGEDTELARAERHYIVRLWWIYAIHRVLAMKRLRPRVPWMDIMWRARSHRRYKDIVTNIAKTTSVQVQQPLIDYAQGWERVLLEELQMQLPLGDIVQCRKNALAITQKRKKNHRVRSARGSASAKRLHTKASMPKSNDGYGKSSKSMVAQASMPKSNDGYGRSSKSMVAQDRRPAWLSSAQGAWEVCIPVVEVRVLRSVPWSHHAKSRPEMRGLLLYASASGIFIDAHATAAAEEETFFSAALTVDHIHLRTLDADPLLLGGTHHLCTVLRPLCLPPPVWFGAEQGRRVGNEVVFAARGQLNSDNNGQWEVHIPDLRVIVYEPLLLLLASYAKLDPVPIVSWMEPTGHEDAARSPGKHSQRVPDRKVQRLTVQSSQEGTRKTSLEVDEAGLLAMSACRSDLRGRPSDLRGGVRSFMESLKKNQRSFELPAGLVGLSGHLDVHVRVGAVHCSQVCEYSRTHLLIEQCRILPFSSHASRGPKDEVEEVDVTPGSLANRALSLDVNEFGEGSLMPWDDTSWGEPFLPLPKDPVKPDVPLPNTSWDLGGCLGSFFKASRESEGAMLVGRRLAERVPRRFFLPEVEQVHTLDSDEAETRRQSASFVVDVRMIPCAAFNEEWLVKESLTWHKSIRGLQATCHSSSSSEWEEDGQPDPEELAVRSV